MEAEPTRSTSPRDWLPAVSLALALLPFLWLIWNVTRYAVDVPVWDQWELVPLLERLHTGRLTWRDLWAQHNEHRLFFPRIIMLLLARASGWSIFWELAVILTLAAGVMGVLAAQLRNVARAAGKPQLQWWLLSVLALQVFSLQQTENWLLGYEINVFLNVLCVALGFTCLARSPLRWQDFTAACLCGIVALYSFASGAVFWVVGGLVLLAMPDLEARRRWTTVALWSATAMLVIGTYLIDFHIVSEHPSLLFILQHPLAYGRYLLTFLGAPVASFEQQLAFWAGLLNLGLFPALAVMAWQQAASVRRALGPLLALALYAVGSAAAISLGRAGFGIDQALSSRYVTFAYFLGLANLVLLVVLGVPTLGGTRRWRLWALPVAGALVLSIGFSSWRARLDFRDRWAYLTPARAALMSLANDATMDRLYPNPDILHARAQLLQMRGWSVFRSHER